MIKHERKSLLFNKGQAWGKRNNTTTFDVTMGSFDGAEICDLVGLYLLEPLRERFGDNIGLYRDDGLGAIRTTPRLGDKARKDLIAIFAHNGLKITATANLKIVNFLDITFDLTNGTYKPYRKPNDEPLYVNNSSNHPPPSVLQKLPASINKRINKLSCNEQTFNIAVPLYNDALKRSNFNTNLTYEPTDNNRATANNSQRRIRRRQRNVTWYNPPYRKNVKTNIARNFLQLIDKHFPPSHRLHNIFNRHTVRVSYSCMDNMKTFIQRHNKHILSRNDEQNQTQRQEQHTNEPPTCNCRARNDCPMTGKCLSRSVIYQADVSTDNESATKSYVGVTANQFKERYRNHVKSFQHAKYANNTELSKYVWKLKKEKQPFEIKWSIIKHVKAYKPGSQKCNLCLEEKLAIMKRKHKNLLNKRTEFFTKCRHVTRYIITKHRVAM